MRFTPTEAPDTTVSCRLLAVKNGNTAPIRKLHNQNSGILALDANKPRPLSRAPVIQPLIPSSSEAPPIRAPSAPARWRRLAGGQVTHAPFHLLPCLSQYWVVGLRFRPAFYISLEAWAGLF